MVLNFGYIKTPSGIIKCVSIAFIAITLILASLGILNSEYVKNREGVKPLLDKEKKEINLWREFYFLASTTVCLILSIINLITYMISRDIYWNRMTAIYDFFHHVLAFLLLSTSGVLNVVSAVLIFGLNCTSENGCQEFELKIAAGGISLISALICGVIAAVVLTNRKSVERDGLIGYDDK